MTKRPKQGRDSNRGGGGMVDSSGRRWQHEDARYLRRWVSGQDHLRRLRGQLPRGPLNGEPPR